MTMENAQIANIFDEIGDLLELREANQFRIRSYRNAAQSIRNLSERIEDLADRGEDLSEIPDIGDATAEKIHQILKTGTCKRLENLRKKVDEGVADLMKVPGIGPRTAMQLHEDLGIASLDELKEACENHQVRELDGMGEKTEKNMLKGISTVKSTAGRILYSEASEHLATLSEFLNDIGEVDRWEVAGSFRRGKETIGDLDILIHAEDREKAADAILDYEEIADVIGQGKEKVSVRLKAGPQIDFRFFKTSEFGSAMVYFTGSKAHNIEIRKIAQDHDWKLNEYGLFKGDHRLAGKTEESVYSRLNLDWVPPEMRENRGEVDAARKDKLPTLIEFDDVKGDLQCHTTASDGNNSIREMADAAQEFGLDFLAITDHSKRVTMAKGLDDDAALKHADDIQEVDEDIKRFWLLAGIEVDILKSGKLDLKDKTLESMDWVVASVHYNRNMSRKAMTDRIVSALSSGLVHALGHPLGRIIGQREPMPVDIDRIIEACIENSVFLEINCQPNRLDLPDHYCRDARDAGVKFTLGTDAHSTEGFSFLPFGINVARRGWLRKEDVINTKSITELRKELRKKH
jgi:DNA polymerase (family 10)